MSHAITDISIKGWDKTLIVTSLSLRQSYNDHHAFELTALVPEGFALTLDRLKDILGETATISIRLKETPGVQCRFTGFVDQTVPVWTPQGRALRVLGYSPTVFMDCGPRFRTFGETSVGAIVDKVANAYSSKISSLTKKGATGKVDFSVQTQETDYRYLCRLADQYGKVFFYDGEKMFFGDLKEKDDKADQLQWASQLKQVELSLNLAPLNFKLSGYALEASKVEEYSRPKENVSSNALVGAAIEESKIYPTSNIFLLNLNTGQSELADRSERLLSKQAYDLVRLQGVSNNPSLKVGDQISIGGSHELFGEGEYIILDINHSVSSDSTYRNTFSAVPAGYPFAMRMQATRNPLCGPLMAVVKENNDPKKLGRVRVQFIGDEEKTLSPWLRILTPYTGNGGWYYLPEVGDQVVVQAEDFNIEKFPFVSGAFYHGKADAAQWHDPQNKKKGFTTERVAFKIDDRTGKLTIEADDIEIIARKKIKTQSEESEFAARQKMKLDGGAQLKQQAARIDLN